MVTTKKTSSGTSAAQIEANRRTQKLSIEEILYYIVLGSGPAFDEVRVFSREGVVERVECPPVR